MKNNPLKLNVFLIFIYIATLGFGYYFISSGAITLGFNFSDIKIVVFLSLLKILTESFTVDFKNVSFSTGFAVTVAAFVLQGPFVAMIVVVMGFTFRVIKDKDEYIHILNSRPWIVMFNYCNLLLPIMIGNYLFIKTNGVYGSIAYSENALPIFLFCLTGFLMNVIIMGIAMGLRSNGKSLLFYVIGNIKLGAISLLAMAPLGLFAAYIFYPSNYFALILFTAPIILARFTVSQYVESTTKYKQTVDVIMHAMEARDPYTEGHSQNVSKLTEEIARELKYNEWRIEDLCIAALLHDVGKIGVNDEILRKPGKLTDEEFALIKQHPEIGYKILKDVKDIDKVLEIVRHHHERYDGNGYPDRKKASELPLDVFIVQLADSVDAMATVRPYKKAMAEDEILAEVMRCKGTQFHPVVVDAYLRYLQKKKKQEA